MIPEQHSIFPQTMFRYRCVKIMHGLFDVIDITTSDAFGRFLIVDTNFVDNGLQIFFSNSVDKIQNIRAIQLSRKVFQDTPTMPKYCLQIVILRLTIADTGREMIDITTLQVQYCIDKRFGYRT